MRTLFRRAILAAMPAVTLPAALLAAPGTALAGRPPATVQITDQAALQPDGSVVVTVRYSCFPSGAELSMSLVQGQAVTVDTNAVCDGAKHTLDIDVPGAPGPFMPGDAGAAATIIAGGGNLVATTQTTVKVK